MSTSLLSHHLRAGATADHIHVLCRHLLVAQAIESGLAQRELVAAALPWEQRFELVSAPPGQVLLLLDDLADREAIHQAVDLVEVVTTRTVVLTDRLPGPVWGALLAAGAAEVMSYTSTLADVDDLLVRVLAGEPVLTDVRRAGLEAEWAEWLREERQLQRRAAALTTREHEILRRLTEGQRIADIGRELGVTESTVRSQVKSLRSKLGVDSQLAAVAAAHRLKGRLIEPPPSYVSVVPPRYVD